MKARHGNGNGHGNSLAIEALRLLPTPGAADAKSAVDHKGGNPTLTGTFEPERLTRHRSSGETTGQPSNGGSD